MGKMMAGISKTMEELGEQAEEFTEQTLFEKILTGELLGNLDPDKLVKIIERNKDVFVNFAQASINNFTNKAKSILTDIL
jgi:hypothetical protein